jgi:N-acetyl-gamma-glutamylphosphate reductase
LFSILLLDPITQKCIQQVQALLLDKVQGISGCGRQPVQEVVKDVAKDTVTAMVMVKKHTATQR